MTEARARVRFELTSRAENVALVRAGLGALDQVLNLGVELVSDLKTAVSEACNNVVVHAYEEQGPGPLTVTLQADAESVEVLVRDRGTGIRQLATSERGMGLGLGVMSALAQSVEFSSPSGGGTEVRMSFRRPGVSDSEHDEDRHPHGTDWHPYDRPQLKGETVVWLHPPTLIGPVFGRVLRATAVTSRFSVERVSQLAAVSEALAACGAGGRDPVGIGMTAATRELTLTAGPFPATAPTAELAEVVQDLSQTDGNEQLTLSFAIRDASRPT